jgi:hypothetical protein
MARRKYKAEGSFADAANNHGFKRCRFRGMAKVRIQNLLIAAIQNLRKLMRHLSRGPGLAVAKTAISARLTGVFVNLCVLVALKKAISRNLSEY